MGQEREIIEGAIALIDRPYGWTKGREKVNNAFNKGATAYCALGALKETERILSERILSNHTECRAGNRCVHYMMNRDFENALNKIKSVVEEHYPEIGPSITEMNDRKETKKADVIAMLEKAATEF